MKINIHANLHSQKIFQLLQRLTTQRSFALLFRTSYSMSSISPFNETNEKGL